MSNPSLDFWAFGWASGNWPTNVRPVLEKVSHYYAAWPNDSVLWPLPSVTPVRF